jgi:molybdopterin converting factor small subunit
MVHVVAADSNARRFTGGASEFDVEGATVGRVIAELERRYPGFGDHIHRRMAIAIDGEIHQDADLVALAPTSEVYLIPRIGGG